VCVVFCAEVLGDEMATLIIGGGWYCLVDMVGELSLCLVCDLKNIRCVDLYEQYLR